MPYCYEPDTSVCVEACGLRLIGIQVGRQRDLARYPVKTSLVPGIGLE